MILLRSMEYFSSISQSLPEPERMKFLMIGVKGKRKGKPFPGLSPRLVPESLSLPEIICSDGINHSKMI